MNVDSDVDFDSQHLWHPYTRVTDPLPCYKVRAANGVFLELEDGRTLIDGMSSWWACIHGYNVPALNQALLAQSERMSHVMFGGLTHQPAIELGKILLDIVPRGLEHVFFADSGSVSVEVALKMALQYQRGRGRSQRRRFLSFKGGYHGDTFGAMSVCDPEKGMHCMFQDMLPQTIFAPKPERCFHESWQDDDFNILCALLRQHQDEIAAVIIEPVVQGAGGLHFYHPNYLSRLQRLCRALDILWIADEIATGFGRTGRLFACEWAQCEPDILCLGKALTGGYMTLAATLCTSCVAKAIDESDSGVLMHGPTFMANPLACRVASASIRHLLSQDWRSRIQQIEHGLQTVLQPLQRYACVRDVRCLGAIGVVETTEPVDLARVQRCFVEQGVWMRPFGHFIYVMPPYIIEDEQIKKLTAAVEVVLRNWSNYASQSR